MGTKFDDSFWETDFNGTQGFDLLCKRMREGQKVCHDVIDFFKKRSKADLQYSKTLRTLSRTADGREEIGDLGLSWQAIKTHTEKTAKFLEVSSQQYNRLADELSRFEDTSKTEIKQNEDKVKEKQKMKRNAYSKMIECQRTYNDKCRDKINFEQQYEAAKQSVSTTLKELEKCKTKAEKSREVMEKSDKAYRQAVETLEQIRVSWEAYMIDSCQNFQKLEEERIYNIRDGLWKCSNIDSQLCVDWDESCETVRQYLEKCDIQKEMVNYITHNMTGGVRPARIDYFNYFKQLDSKDESLSPQGNELAVPKSPNLRRSACCYQKNTPPCSPSTHSTDTRFFNEDPYASID